MYEFKPRPKVVPQKKAVSPTSKVKPDPELEKEKLESTTQSDIQSPEKTDGVHNSDTTHTGTGLQDDATTAGDKTGAKGDAFQQLIANDPITQLLDNDPITQLLKNDPFIQLVNNTNAPKDKLTEEETKDTTVQTIAIKDTGASQNKPKQEIATSSPEAAISSVTKLPPLQAFGSMKEATTIAAQAQQGQLAEAQAGMEEITIPTGIDAASEVSQPKVKALPKGKVPKIKTPTTAKKVTADKDTKKLDKATKKAPIGKVTTKRGAFIKDIQQSRENLGNVQTAAQSDLGAQPAASFDEASNPAQIQANNIQAQQSVGNELGNAQKATIQDFGESGMFPKKAHKKAKINIKTELTEQRESLLSQDTEMPSFDDTETASINQELQARYQNEIDTASQDMQTAGTDKDQNIIAEKSKHQQDMMNATEEAKAAQRAERGKGQRDVVNQKQNWQAENQKIKEDASMQLAKEQTKNEASITKKQTEGNQQIADTYAKADKDIEAKTKKADQDVAQQEKEGVEKEEKGWFDSAIDWVSDQFDKIKKAVNFIFDKLRAAVKSLVNWAKEKASGIINAVRDFAIKAVKVFGEIAKSVVSAALFMFPETAAKFNAYIDKKVAQTVQVINKLAEALEKTVHALLDVIGKVIDMILVLYQKAINLALDVLEAITVGVLIIIRFLANLGIGASYSTIEFLGALGEEALGGNPGEPLQDTEVSIQNEGKWSQAMGLPEGRITFDGKRNGISSEGASIPEVLTKNLLADDDVAITPNPLVEMDPSLASQQFNSMKDGEVFELGGSASPITREQIQEQAAGQEGFASDLGQETTGTEGATGGSTDFYNMSDENKLTYYNDQMLQESEAAGSKEPNGPEPKSQPVNDTSPAALMAKTGRLSIGRRIKYFGQQMLTGVKVLWNKYKAYIIGGLIAALIIAGVAAFFTGGAAVLAAVQLIMNALILVFGAIAIYRASGKIKEYVQLAWNNNPKDAGKALASAFAIIVVEFLIDRILLGMGKVLKTTIKAVKATKVGKFVAKNTKGIRKITKGAIKGSKKGLATIGSRLKGNKLVISFNKKVGKGIKKFNTFRNRVLDKLGFKKVWFERHGNRLQLWGQFNAKVLLSNIDINDQKQKGVIEIDSKKLRKDLDTRQIVGKKTKVGEQDGIIIADEGNKFSNKIENSSKADQIEEFGKLDKLDDAARAEKIRGGVKSERVSLRKDVKDEIFETAYTGRKDANGHKIYFDGKTHKDIPNFGTHYPEFTPLGHKHPKAGQRVPENLIGQPRADIGHIKGQTWEKRLKKHKEKGSTRKEIIEAENNPDLYILEERSSNRSRKLD
ncbi:GH-E family nuclease [Dokdonia sp.]|uniref:GH-E family nuclease n=1 Tax=Dokdonia sp. TaxID=2024995 RepID=UPI0032639293